MKKCLTCEVEYGWCCNDDRQAVRDDWVLVGVVVRLITLHHTSDRVGQPVAKVDAGVAETDA